ncbi:MAG: DinB family protein [Asgard group archaeon]|nr:DinB family protein [Asgard group archaeon]
MTSVKENAIKEMKIAESNFFMVLNGIKPEDITKQVHPEVNTIAWIVGHLVSHMDAYQSIFTGKRHFSEEQRKYFGYGSPKQTMEDGMPYSFVEIIDSYLEISENYFKNLAELPEENYDQIPPIEGFKESYLDLLHRISLHYMGHIGQIVLIRRMLGRTNKWSFVAGVSQKIRDQIFENWLEWWKSTKENFD